MPIRHKWTSMLKAVVVIGLTIAAYVYVPYTSPDEITRLMERAGRVAPAVFILVTAIKPAVFFLPSLGLTIVAGTLFGPLWGTVYVIAGGAVSTIVGFYMTRLLARGRVREFLKTRHKLLKLDEKMTTSGFKTCLMLRAFNLPWDVVSYGAGLSGMRFKDFYLASLAAIVPVSFIYTYFGSSIMHVGTQGFYLSILLVLLSGSGPHLYNRYMKNRPRVIADE
ncbi:MAG: TVP38/TMEM64 family protein [Deltaproteobacteria bacterium]|nr:TVP38/TMEM64 family protein [Deltaproteobacteria bacterium]